MDEKRIWRVNTMMKQMDKVTQGRTIRERRKKLGITQEVLAEELSKKSSEK